MRSQDKESVGHGKKVQIKYYIDYLLYRYYISWNKESKITITDAESPSMNQNDILVLASHLQDRKQTNQASELTTLLSSV